MHNDGTADGTIVFTECHTYSRRLTVGVCKPVEPIIAGGTLWSSNTKVKTYVKATSEGGCPFTTLEFGEECSLPEEVPITGTGWIVDCEGIRT